MSWVRGREKGAIAGRRIVATVIVFVGWGRARERAAADEPENVLYNTVDGTRTPSINCEPSPPGCETLKPAPGASVFYELMSDALVWSDEIPDLNSGNVRDFHCLRFVFRYRTTLMLGAPDARFRDFWERGAQPLPRLARLRPAPAIARPAAGL